MPSGAVLEGRVLVPLACFYSQIKPLLLLLLLPHLY
jgi:hypothetical protein